MVKSKNVFHNLPYCNQVKRQTLKTVRQINSIQSVGCPDHLLMMTLSPKHGADDGGGGDDGDEKQMRGQVKRFCWV